MKALKLSGLIVALFAGTAISTLPALSQQSGTQPRILPQQGEQTEGTTQPDGSSGAMPEQEQSPAQTDTGAGATTDQPSGQSAQEPTQPGVESAQEPTQPSEESAQEPTQSSDQTAEEPTQPSGQSAQENDQDATDGPSGETTASINITEEQKTEIHNVIVESDVEPVEADIDVDIGISVPRTIELHPLPPRIVEIVPEYEGYVYFVLADGRIIIVEPDTYEIVYIIVV